MCGIAGVIGLGAVEGRRRLDVALDRLVHRGPDGAGVWVGDGFAIGMRRLSIIDLAGGDQPIFNEDRSVGVVCNGEIYNYLEVLEDLRARGHSFQSQSDINTIPHLYEESGVDGIAPARGMFAAALWDNPRSRLVLWRDRVGKKPLFFAEHAAGIAFASELPALIALLDRQPSIDWHAVAWYLRLGFVPHPLTIYEGVRVLPPGACLVRENDRPAVIRNYWEPTRAADFTDIGRREAVEQVDGWLRDATKLRLRSDVPLGVFLSGGIDSGLVSALAVDLGASDLLAFVVEVDDPALNEAPLARMTAKRLGLQVETIPLSIAPVDEIQAIPARYGQPFADASAIPSYLVSRAAAKHRKVVLNGDGGDEVFGGYRRYQLGRLARRLPSDPPALLHGLDAVGRAMTRASGRRSRLGFVGRAVRGVGLAEADRYLAWSVDVFTPSEVRAHFGALPQTVWGENDAPQAPKCGDLRSMMLSDFGLILPDDLLVKMDIATMANSLEARSPLLDVPMIENVWGLPSRLMTEGGRTKPLLRDLAARYLPDEVTVAPKRGFEVPVERWLKHDLRPMLNETLLAGDSRVARFADQSFVRDLVADPQRAQGSWATSVWTLLVLELFLRSSTPTVA